MFPSGVLRISDCRKIAKSLNGGGHEYSAAARIEGDSAEDVVKIVLSKIEEYITLS